jgi:hypothetical protein
MPCRRKPLALDGLPVLAAGASAAQVWVPAQHGELRRLRWRTRHRMQGVEVLRPQLAPGRFPSMFPAVRSPWRLAVLLLKSWQRWKPAKPERGPLPVLEQVQELDPLPPKPVLDAPGTRRTPRSPPSRARRRRYPGAQRVRSRPVWHWLPPCRRQKPHPRLRRSPSRRCPCAASRVRSAPGHGVPARAPGPPSPAPPAPRRPGLRSAPSATGPAWPAPEDATSGAAAGAQSSPRALTPRAHHG